MKLISYNVEMKAKISSHCTRRKRLLPLLAVLALIIAAILLLPLHSRLLEKNTVQQQNISRPTACVTLKYQENIALCESMIISAYSSKPALEREPICSQTRTLYGQAAALCELYDDARAAWLHNTTLQARGIAIWEPDTVVSSSGILHVRILNAPSSVSLVCNGTLIPIQLRISSEEIIITYQQSIKGSCQIIAGTQEGSVTTNAFQVI